MPKNVHKNRIEIVTPAQVVFAGFCLMIAFLFVSSWLSSMYEHLSLDSHIIAKTELSAQLKGIERRLAAKEDELQVMLLPEGKLFANSFYGFVLINMSLFSPADADFRGHALIQLEKQLTTIKSMEDKYPFAGNAKIKPKGGIIIAGHSNLLRAGSLMRKIPVAPGLPKHSVDNSLTRVTYLEAEYF